jgi:hypothetical protein
MSVKGRANTHVWDKRIEAAAFTCRVEVTMLQYMYAQGIPKQPPACGEIVLPLARGGRMAEAKDTTATACSILHLMPLNRR